GGRGRLPRRRAQEGGGRPAEDGGDLRPGEPEGSALLFCGAYVRLSGGVLLIDNQNARPIPEDLLDDRPYLLPGEAAIAHPDPRQGDALDALGVCQLAHPPQSLFDRLIAGPGAPVALLGAEVEYPRPPFVLPQPGIAQVELPGVGFTAGTVLLVP